MAKKKDKKRSAPTMSPEKYITTRARQLPLGKTYICRTAASDGTYPIIVTRVHAGGNLTIGLYLVDMFCLGVKDTYYYFSIDPDDFKDNVLSAGIDYEETEYVEAHNIIYGALEYAEEAGIEPHRDFKISEYILEPDDDNIPLMEFEFGHNGVRELVISPDGKERKFIPVLEKNVPGEYVVSDFSGSYYDDDDYGDEDTYEATTGSNDPNSFNFDFHPFPHDPYPKDLAGVRHNELLDVLYPVEKDLGITLDAKEIATIRAISRDELISDLRRIVGYELGMAEDEIEDYCCYNEDESNVMYQICAILAEFGGSDTKDLVRTMLQQSYYWQEAYLGDYGLELMHSLLAKAYEDNPEELARMVVEQGYSAHSRVTMLYSLECIALWHPAVRERVERELHDLAELILHGDGSELPLLNDFIIGTLSTVMIGLAMRSDLPLIKEMHDRHLVDERVFGDYEDQLKELPAIEESDYIETRFTNLEQIYKAYR